MARTPSTMLPLGTRAPDFQLPDTTGKVVALGDFSAKEALLVMFICNHCPFVKHVRSELASLGTEYSARDVAIVAVSSNDAVNYPEDSPAKMAEEAREAGYAFPYLFDESQAVALAYRAACTPDFFLFDKNRNLVYRGQLDDSRVGTVFLSAAKIYERHLMRFWPGSRLQPNKNPALVVTLNGSRATSLTTLVKAAGTELRMCWHRSRPSF